MPSKYIFATLIALAALVAGAPLPGAGDGVAHADAVKAKFTTSVYASPGEASKVVTRVRSGKSMTVLRRDGRWIKVRVNGLTGWITRTSVESRAARSAPAKNRKVSFVEGRSRRDEAESGPSDRIGADVVDKDGDFDTELSEVEPEPEPKRRAKPKARKPKAKAKPKRKARKKSRKKSKRVAMDEDEFDDDEDFEDDEEEAEEEEEEKADEPDMVVVSADEAELFAKPSRRSRSVDSVASGDKLLVLERDGKWILVETDNGEEGWIRAKDVGTKGYRYEKLGKSAHAGVGYRTVTQVFRSASTDPLGNYTVGSGAAVVGVGGDLIYDYSKQYLIRGDATFSYTRANPGIRFNDAAGNPSDIAFNVITVTGGVSGGYKISSETGMAAYGRVGYYYEKFGVNDAMNAAGLPSELLSGITVGLMLDVPKYKKYSGRISLDYMSSATIGKRQQTAGLEDGTLSEVSAIWGEARVEYQWKKDLQLSGAYQYAGVSTEWTGRPEMSNRPHLNDANSNTASRDDTTHTLMVGVARSF